MLHTRTISEGPDFIRLFLKVSYWTAFIKYCVSLPYLRDLILCDFFQSHILNFFWLSLIWSCGINRTSKNHIWRTWFHVTFFKINAPYQDHIWWTRFYVTFFSNIRFKYLEDECRMFCFFKLVLVLVKWFECFPKRLWISSQTKILNFYFL